MKLPEQEVWFVLMALIALQAQNLDLKIALILLVGYLYTNGY